MKTITIWLTRFALTAGMTKHDVVLDPRYPDYVHLRISNAHFESSYKLGVDAHLTEDAAKLRAEEMRTKAIAACEAKLERLKTLIIKYE